MFLFSFLNAQTFKKLSELVNYPEAYISVSVDAGTLRALSSEFVIDKVVVDSANGILNATVWLPARDFHKFENTGIEYSIPEPKWTFVQMANTYSELSSQWNRYPTYQAFLSTMKHYSDTYPELCTIDTILSETPEGHSILCAHISNDNGISGKPSILYSSTIHGDEVLGYYMLIRLIDCILSEYQTNSRVKALVDSIDIWICPLHNPDGTYHTADNQINDEPVSIRANANQADLNRCFPVVGAPVAKQAYEPEVEAMMSFMESHNFTLAANLHGGAEVFNYPWDSWMTWQRTHADKEWWNYVGRSFADTCHKYNPSYMSIEDNGVTPGGDWYVITGSMQDYHNYFVGTRHVTIEVGDYKVTPSYQLPLYWEYVKSSLLNLIGEANFGLHGRVTDSLTGEPVLAKVFVENHDADHSYVETALQAGDYHRPIKGGTYSVTYSAPGYVPKTIPVSLSDGERKTLDIALQKTTGIAEQSRILKIYPNPVSDLLYINAESLPGIHTAEIYSVSGQLLISTDNENVIDVSGLARGIYFVKLKAGGAETVFKINKM